MLPRKKQNKTQDCYYNGLLKKNFWKKIIEIKDFNIIIGELLESRLSQSDGKLERKG